MTMKQRSFTSVNSVIDNQREGTRVGKVDQEGECVSTGNVNLADEKGIEHQEPMNVAEEKKATEKQTPLPHRRGHKKELQNEDFADEASGFVDEGPNLNNPHWPTDKKKAS